MPKVRYSIYVCYLEKQGKCLYKNLHVILCFVLVYFMMLVDYYLTKSLHEIMQVKIHLIY